MFVNRRLAVAISAVLAVAMIATLTPFSSYGAKKKPELLKVPDVQSSSYIVMSASTSEDVYAVHEDRKMPMGNITKLMTAMVVIDNIHDDSEYSNIIEIDNKVARYGAEFKAGDRVSVEDLIAAMIVGCSDQAAEALARYSASDREIFISEMNSKAVEIGLMSTQYANPTGRYDADHYSTAEESAIVLQYAIRYERIKNLSKLEEVSVSTGKGDKKSVVLSNTNPLIASAKTSQLYKNCGGGLMGIMDEPEENAQFIGIATKDGMQLIVCMLDADKDKISDNAIDLFEYGYQEASHNQIVSADKVVGHVRVRGGAKTRVPAYTEIRGFAYIPPEGSTDLVHTEVVLEDDITAPLKEGTKVGEYRIFVADELKGTVDLIVKEDVPEGWFLSKIYISNLATFLIAFVIFLIVCIILRLRAVNKRKKKLRAIKKRERIRELAMKQEAYDQDRKLRNWTYSKYYDSHEMEEAIKSKNKRNKKK